MALAGLMQPMGVHLQPMQPMHLPLSLVAPCSDPEICSATAESALVVL